MKKYIFAAAIISLSASAQDKSSYHLFNPTPKEQMREFATERPTKSAASTTVDAGHWLIETEVLNFNEDGSGRDEVRTLTLLSTIIRLGILNSLEAQLEIDPFIEQVSDNDGPNRKTINGVGQTAFRLKQNLLGNDSGSVSISLQPGVVFATAKEDLRAHERVEGSLALPFNWNITSLWSLNGMVQYDNINDDPDLSRQSNVQTMIGIGRNIFENYNLQLEIFNNYKNNPKWTNETTLDIAVQYSLNEMTKLDAGTFIGLSPEATDAEYFVGASLRF
jgi:hypothetical protein